jgi:hypothetical protein
VIGVVSDHLAFCKAVERLLLSIGEDDIVLMKPTEQVHNLLVPSAPLVLDAHLDDGSGIGKGGLTLIRRLRSDQAWHYIGFIVVIAYEPTVGLIPWPDAQVLTTKAITLLQMPFTVTQFQTTFTSASPLSDAEWNEIHRRLGPRSVADCASRLGHHHENVFSQALAALRELEKLGAFSEPDNERINREIQTIRSKLTEERLRTFFVDLRTLSKQALSQGLLDQTRSFEQLDGRIANVERWLPLMSLDRRTGKLSEICRAAHEIRSALRELLATFTAIKNKAAEEGECGN